MMDIGGVGYITIKEFKLVMESTQRILNDVDEYFLLTNDM